MKFQNSIFHSAILHFPLNIINIGWSIGWWILKSWFLQFLAPNSFTILILEYSLIKQINNQESSLLEKCPYSELFWSVFSRIRTISPYSVRMRELLTSSLPQICDSKITSRVSSRMYIKDSNSYYKNPAKNTNKHLLKK